MEQEENFGYGENDGVMDPLPASPEVNYNWVDVTNDFMSSIKELDLGELLHDELFGLFEAMSAIEMMDPKMDAGMHCNRGSTKPLTFQQAVETGKLKLDDLTPAEIIGVIDATFSCIVSWLEGHSLAQTVFTNLYLHRPQAIVDKTLRVYCMTVYKILDLIRNYINIAQVFEEEDFQPMMYGFRLGWNPQVGGAYDTSAEITEQKCIAALREQEDDLHRRSRNNPLEGEALIGLFARIKFTRMFYQTLTLLTKKDHQANNDCVRLLAGCSEMMIIINKTVCKGTQPEENSDMPNPMGFEPLVNQRLLPPTFPRYTRIKPRAETMQYFDELISKLRHAMKITSIPSYRNILDFFMEFSRSQPCILSRSALQLLYLGGAGGTPVGAGVAEAIREAAKNIIPALIPRHQLLNNPQPREYVDTFLNRCTGPFMGLLQVCGHNRARQRDKLAHLLDEFASLQEEAENFDGCLRHVYLKLDPPRPHLPSIGTWILYYVLRIMIMYLLSGLELELYSVHEYHYIFWYLYEFLYGWLVSALSRADSILAEQEAANALSGGGSGGSGSGSGPNNRRAPKAHANRHKKRPPPQRPSQREALHCQIMQNLCGGYYTALVAFQLQGKIPQPMSAFDDEAVRYKHRFAPLSIMTPHQVQYKEFKDMTQPLRYEQPAVLYMGGCKHFQQARALMETITNPDQEITDLLKVAKTNYVVLKLLADGHKSNSTTPPDFDFTLHRHFPIIKLV